MFYINKIKKYLHSIRNIDNKLGDLQVAIGRIEERQTRQSGKIEEFKVFSQWGEDGIIQYLIKNINISKPIFIEFGVENYTESNTRFLLINNNWSGLVIDGSKEHIDYIKKDDIYWKYNLKADCEFVSAENINDLLERNGIQGKIGILSIDIDGNDYWVWKAIRSIEPDIVICEYNSRFGKEKAVTIPYDANFMRLKKHYSGLYYGASIKALESLGHEKGYSLVAGTSTGINLFFVKSHLLNEKVRACSIEAAFRQAHLRQSRNMDGSLEFLNIAEEENILDGLEVIDVSIHNDMMKDKGIQKEN